MLQIVLNKYFLHTHGYLILGLGVPILSHSRQATKVLNLDWFIAIFNYSNIFKTGTRTQCPFC
jgi:hypothetical protein